MNNFFRHFRKGRIYAVAFVIFGFCVLIGGVLESIAQAAPREYSYALEDFELETRQYLECGIDFVIANYAETTEEETTFGVKTNERDYSQSYIIPCWDVNEDIRFISAEVTYYPYIQEFNKIYDLTYSENEEDWYSQAFEFTGRVQKLDSEMLEYAFQGMLQTGLVTNRTEFDEIFLPYNIMVVAPNSYNTPTLFVMGIILIVAGAVIFFIDVMAVKKQAALAAAAQFNSDSYSGDNTEE
jgi:hypothetical protein